VSGVAALAGITATAIVIRRVITRTRATNNLRVFLIKIFLSSFIFVHAEMHYIIFAFFLQPILSKKRFFVNVQQLELFTFVKKETPKRPFHIILIILRYLRDRFAA
jgi:hypothetical protein